MSGYFGTDLQKRLQRRTFENRLAIAETPGLYNAGRFVGTDDPDKVGWQGLADLFRENGMLGFRLITPEQGKGYLAHFAELGCRIDSWDVFSADAAKLRDEVEAITRTPLPAGLALAQPLRAPEAPRTAGIQEFLARNGLAPFPGSMLIDAPQQATVVVADANGEPAAVAHAYFPHNRYSPHRSAWVGLVAVDPARRGGGLGRHVTAHAVRLAVTRLGAASVYALVASTNEPSRRMVESAGLAFRPDLLCSVAVPADVSRFTR